MKRGGLKKNHTHEWEFDQEPVLHDWCHGKELYLRPEIPKQRVIKKTAHL